GAAVFDALQEAEPGTFYLTDYLVRHFDALVMGGLGLDRHPQLRHASCGADRRVVHLAQTDSAELRAAAEVAADRLGLACEHRDVGLGPFRAAVERILELA